LPERTENYQPRTVIWREADYVVHLQQVLGILDFDMNFDNAFQRWKLMMQFIDDVSEAIQQDIIPLKSKGRLDLIPNKMAILKMDKIWNGETYLGVIKNHDNTRVLLRKLFYKHPDEYYEVKDGSGKVIDVYKREIIPMPKLKNMIPVGKIDSDTWGIQIRESMPLRYAWQSANYATIINDGKFVHNLSDVLIPKIEAQDMKSLIKRTYILHRPVYNAIMDILPKYFNKNYFVFAGNVHKIMQWMEDEGVDLSDIIDTTSQVKSESNERTENNQQIR